MNSILLSLFFFSFLGCLLCQDECFQKLSLSTPENELLHSVDEKLKAKQPFSASCLDLLIRRGYFKTASHLYDNYFLLNQIPVRTDLESSLSSSKRDLDQLYNTIMTSDVKIHYIEPVFQWAQSYKYIYIQVKFAHRLDSPGCLGVSNEVVNFTNNTLFLSAFGIQAHQPIAFTLNLTLFDDIIPENSTWKMEAVGTMFFNLTKANDTLWRRLIVQKEKKIPVWWHMGSEQTVEMREFARMLDDEDEEREREADKKKKKKKKSEKKPEEKPAEEKPAEEKPAEEKPNEEEETAKVRIEL